MKNVIKMFVAVAIMGTMSVSAFAQGAGPGGAKGGPAGGQKGPGGQRRGGMMKLDEEVLAKLNLTADQKSKVKALKEATTKKVQELMKASGFGKPGGPGAAGKPGGPGAAGGGMREKMKPIMDGYTNGMKAILTPTQFTAYEKGVKEARAKMRAQFGGGKPGGPGGPAGAGKKKGTPPPTA